MTNSSGLVVWGMESGPEVPGRPVAVGSRGIGIAESWQDVDRLLAAASVAADADVVWQGGDADQWE